MTVNILYILSTDSSWKFSFEDMISQEVYKVYKLTTGNIVYVVKGEYLNSFSEKIKKQRKILSVLFQLSF